MQRRQLLKWILPVTLLSASGAAALLARHWLMTPSCSVLSLAELIVKLKPFSDAVLAKKSALKLGADSLTRFDSICEADFDQAYRQLVISDFVQGKTAMVDGWIISETEALTHQLVFSSGVLPAVGSAP